MTRLRLVAIALLAACARQPGATPAPASPIHDVLIRGGRVIDGTGSPWVRADVLIDGDRIAAVGLLPEARARDTIDASGLVVAPGFIDMLGHSEYPLLADGRAVSKVAQGITTELTGEVTSVVPVNARTLAELDEATRALVAWRDLDGYARALASARPAINLGTFVAAGSVRRAVMGDADRAPTASELAQMRAIVDTAMRQGAFGLSAGLVYAPASFASTDEIVALARVAAAHGGGYATHMRSEGDRLLEAVREAIAIGEHSGAWVEIHHLKASGRRNWGKVAGAIAIIDSARARGVDVMADMYPYAASGTGLDATLPSWAHAGGTDSLLARLRDPATRARLRAELTVDGVVGAGIGTSAGGPGGVMIANAAADSLAPYEGRRLDEIARARGQDVVDALFDLLLADRARTAAIYFSMSEEDVERVLRQRWVSIGGDAGARAAESTVRERPHPRAYGTFPRILCRYARERGVLTMEEAVRRFSALPAARMGLDRRGVLKAGMYADVTVFDPATVCDRATFVDPIQLPAGIRHVLVNGVVALRDGKVTDARGGRFLRRR
jgi:dihydroorotase/N-acyl-D-amino-acid deacylase